jgi:hypothetical protein
MKKLRMATSNLALPLTQPEVILDAPSWLHPAAFRIRRFLGE